MTDSPTTWCWQAAGAPKHEDCEDQPGVCWVCGGHAITGQNRVKAFRTLARSKWLGATYLPTAQEITALLSETTRPDGTEQTRVPCRAARRPSAQVGLLHSLGPAR